MAVLHPHGTTVPSYFLSRTAKSSVSSSPHPVTVVQAANGVLDSNTSAVQMPPTMLSGTLLPRSLRLDGRTLLPACAFASPDWRATQQVSPHTAISDSRLEA